MNITRKVLIILGPTATGKTDLALRLASKINGELVSADSRQVYKGLDIGTGKLPSKEVNIRKGKGFWEIDGVKVWMYDVVSLKKQYTVVDYVKDAGRVIGEIRERKKLPIIVGGTGLYLKALFEGLPGLDIPVDKKLRNQLAKFSAKELQVKLRKIDLKKWQTMNYSDQQNPRRLIRSIELTLMEPQKRIMNNKLRIMDYDILKIGLTAKRNLLYEKINKRVYEWIQEGIVDEVKNLIKSGVSKKRFKEIGLEYSMIVDYIDGQLTFDEMINKIQTKVRQYAKRQQTWFKKEKDVNWFDIIDEQYQKKIEKIVAQWYD